MSNNTTLPLHLCSYLNLPEKPDDRNVSNLCGCQNSQKSHCISVTGILLLLLTYTAVGSIMFMALEGFEEEENNRSLETAIAASKPYSDVDLKYADIRMSTVHRLWSITEDLNILYKENWTRLAAYEVKQFQETILLAVRSSKNPNYQSNSEIVTHKWSYASAFLYSLTLITTIGYGGMSPCSQWGKIAALVYAMFGIPIVLLYLSAMGEAMSSGMRCIFRKIRMSSDKTVSSDSSTSQTNNSKEIGGGGGGGVGAGNVGGVGGIGIGGGGTNIGGLYNDKKHGQYFHPPPPPPRSSINHYNNISNTSHHYHHSFSVPIYICLLIIFAYIGMGAALFNQIDEWSLLESLYFCFTSLGTIGFGGLSPSGNLAQNVASAYILIGMAVLAMCFNLIQTEITIWLRKFGVPDQQQQQLQHQQQQQQHHHHHHHHQQMQSRADDLTLITVSVTPKS